MLVALVIMFVAFAIPFWIVHSLTQKYSYATIAGIVALAILIGWAGGYDGTQSWEDSNNQILISADAKMAKSISDAIEPSNPAVRSYALSAIKSSSGGNYNIDQICDIYDKLYWDWVYVNDPAGIEYYAPASESVKLLRGDCDDYAILMASLIESIGGSARVVCAWKANGEGHAYTEVYMGNSESDVQKLIDSICWRYGNTSVNYHIGEENNKPEYWLNLDWTAKNPGGKFYDSTGTALVIRSNGHYKRVTEGG